MPQLRRRAPCGNWVVPCLLVLAGCTESSDGGDRASHDDSGERPAANDGAFANPRGSSSGTGDFSSGAAPTPGSGGPGRAESGGPASDGFDSAGGLGSSMESDAGVVAEPIPPGQLTAGEWSDLEHWDFWRELHALGECNDTANCANESIGARMSAHWGYDLARRVPLRVRHDGQPVVDAVVKLAASASGDDVLWSARTDDDGRAELFAGSDDQPSDFAVIVEAGGERVVVEGVPEGESDTLEVEFPVAHAPSPSLDLMFVVDTTGSMSDELSYIQAELESVIARVRDSAGAPLSLRLSVNFYRDHGDEYVVRPFQFTSDVEQAIGQLAAQRADGGGDTPEAVEEALDDAVNGHGWSDAATARLLFFVLDAPPHHDPARLASLHESTRAAAEKGVRIIPLTASGVDRETEFLMRLLAIATHGSYTFLTDHSGIGNDHLEPTIGQYEVELLDDLLVRVIEESL